ALHWLTDKQKKELQNLDQEHHLLLNEKGKYELVQYDQIINVSGGNRDVRAFVFERKGDYYVTYWHISGDKQLELYINKSDVKLYTNLKQEELMEFTSVDTIIIPVNNRRYLKFSNKSQEQIIDIIENAKIIN